MNWQQRIERAKKNGKFTEDDWFKSRSWSTCAVGEKLKIKDSDEPPTVLGYLGMKFEESVRDDNIPQAEKIYKKIQGLKID